MYTFQGSLGKPYLIKKAMDKSSNMMGSHPLPPLVFLTDKARCANPLPVIEALPPGTAVVLRDYRAKDREKLATEIAGISRRNGLVFLVGADQALARKVGADGLHLPEWMLMGEGRTLRFDENWLITASVHNIQALRKAEALGVDAVFLSAVFETKSHPGKEGLGIYRLQKLASQTDLPFYPLGGITERNLKRLPKMPNMAGIAGISFFTDEN